MRSLALFTCFTLAMADGTGAAHPSTVDPDVENWFLARCMLWLWIALLGVLFSYTLYRHGVQWMRTIVCLNNDTQRYFHQPQNLHSSLRRYFIDAPLFRKRHHREFRLSSAVNMGTLPSRVQAFFLVGYLAMMITLTTISIDFNAPTEKILGSMVSRTGYLTVMNMLPLFLLAGRNNPLLVLTGIGFDTYNLIHRWLGRIVVLEGLLHGLAWIISKEMKSGWQAVAKAEAHSSMVITGTLAIAPFVAILLFSSSAIRHAFYETFLTGHVILAGFAVGATWVHIEGSGPVCAILAVTVAVWVFERTTRMIRLIYRNVGAGGTRAEVEVLPGDAVRVTMSVARPWHFQPGQHAYIYMPSVGLWTSHPFTVAWSDEESRHGDAGGELEKGDGVTASDVLRPSKTRMSFIIRRRTGFTDTLYKKAERSPDGKFSATTFVEGPYGGQSLRSYGTVVLFAAGVGITHQVPHVRDLVSGFDNGTVATRKIVLIWIIQSPEHLEWIRPWMTTILGLPRRREILRVLLFVTRPRSTKEIHSPSSSVQMYPGKPNVQALVDQEVEHAVGAVGVSVCGVGALADDVRSACRRWMGKVNIDFAEESFSW